MSHESLPVIGFVGLGNIGGPMARNMAIKHASDVIVYDANPAAVAGLSDTKARVAVSLQDLAARADIVFLSLPGSPQVRGVCLDAEGLASKAARVRTESPQVLRRPVGLSQTCAA